LIRTPAVPAMRNAATKSAAMVKASRFALCLFVALNWADRPVSVIFCPSFWNLGLVVSTERKVTVGSRRGDQMARADVDLVDRASASICRRELSLLHGAFDIYVLALLERERHIGEPVVEDKVVPVRMRLHRSVV